MWVWYICVCTCVCMVHVCAYLCVYGKYVYMVHICVCTCVYMYVLCVRLLKTLYRANYTSHYCIISLSHHTPCHQPHPKPRLPINAPPPLYAAPLSAPSEPLNLVPSLINSTSFYLRWTAPLSNGGIAIRNYTVQLSDMGNSFGCNPPQWGWVPVVQGVVGLSTWVTNLRPFSSYQAAVVAYNSIKSSNLSLQTNIISTLTSGMCQVCYHW